jgi:hypothetical protein
MSDNKDDNGPANLALTILDLCRGYQLGVIVHALGLAFGDIAVCERGLGGANAFLKEFLEEVADSARETVLKAHDLASR